MKLNTMTYSKKTPMDPEKCVYCLCGKGRLRKDGVDMTDNLLALPWGKILIENMIKKYKWEDAVKHFRQHLREKRMEALSNQIIE